MTLKSSFGRRQWRTSHPLNVRISHWVNVIAGTYLVVSGLHIFLDFPELYWGHTGYRGYPAIFKLEDWGLSWDEAGSLGNRMWGRNYHFTFAWVFLINGLIYVGWNLRTGHLQQQLWLNRDELRLDNLHRDLRQQVRWTLRQQTTTTEYGTLQKLSYLMLIFVFVPLMVLTGLAQSPGFTAAWPWLLDIFGGRQSARTLHSAGTVLFIVFVILHILEVIRAGATNRIRSMFTGHLLISSSTSDIRRGGEMGSADT